MNPQREKLMVYDQEFVNQLVAKKYELKERLFYLNLQLENRHLEQLILQEEAARGLTSSYGHYASPAVKGNSNVNAQLARAVDRAFETTIHNKRRPMYQGRPSRLEYSNGVAILRTKYGCLTLNISYGRSQDVLDWAEQRLLSWYEELEHSPYQSYLLNRWNNRAPNKTKEKLTKPAYLRVSTTTHGKGDENCAICLGDYKENDKTGTLECKHCFHAECIKGWLSRKNVCPVCKATALPVLDLDFHL